MLVHLYTIDSQDQVGQSLSFREKNKSSAATDRNERRTVVKKQISFAWKL